MIHITVNFPDGSSQDYQARGNIAEVFSAVKLLHHGWSSIVLTVVNTTTQPQPGDQ